MSKNTGTSELINYFDLGVNGDVGISGNLTLDTITNATTDTDTFLVSDTGIIKYRTGAQLLSDIGAAPATGGSYLPLAGGTLTGTLNGTSAVFSGDIQSNTRLISSNGGQAIFITANSGGLTNRIEGTSGLPLHIVTTGSSLALAAGGTTTQFTLASTGVVTLSNLAGTGSRIVVSDASGNLSASALINGYVQGSGTTNYLPKFTGSTTIGNSQIFDNGSNVGIGTASPSQKLSVNGEITAVTRIRINTDTQINQIFGDGNAFTGGTSGDLGIRNDSGRILFASGGGTIQMTITSGGNVLIGSTIDNGSGARLQVSGTATISSSLTASGLNARGQTLNNSNSVRFLRADGPEMAYIGWTNENANNSTWYFKSSNGNPIAFSADGTNQQLIIATTGAATFSSTVTATGYITSSDARLKNVISKDGDLAIYSLLDSENIHYGYIAQDMQKDYPNQVHTDDKGFLSLNYVEILVKKVNDLEKKIKQLEQ